MEIKTWKLDIVMSQNHVNFKGSLNDMVSKPKYVFRHKLLFIYSFIHLFLRTMSPLSQNVIIKRINEKLLKPILAQ